MGKRFAVVVCIICLAVFGQENIVKNADWKEIGANGVPVGWSIRPEVIAEHGGDGGADFTLSGKDGKEAIVTYPVVIEPNSVRADELGRPTGPLRYSPGAFAFVCIARFDFQKGQDILLRAIVHAQDELRASGRRTLLVGGGTTLDDMKRFAQASGIADLVEFAGEIPDAGVYMACGEKLVAPSRWEGMPYLLLEAVARGQAVIASDCPGNHDVLKDYAAAEFFPVGDVAALAKVLVLACART